MNRSGMLVSLTMLAGLLACGSDGTGPRDVVKTDAELNVLRSSPTAPPLVTTTASFYARKGEGRELRMYYRPEAGATDSTEFLRFQVNASSLDRRPDGSLVADGDSVLISVTVIDASRLVVDFQPSGLRFSATDPPELRLSFAEANGDINEDGIVDGEDDSAKAQLAIWRRETIADPWVRLASALSVSSSDVRADITGFTNYAIAY